MTEPPVNKWEAHQKAMAEWEAKRKVQMEDEAKLLEVILKGKEDELEKAIEYWKTNFTSELGPPINIRRAELRLMDLRGEPRPDVLHLLAKIPPSNLVEAEKSSGKAAAYAMAAREASKA